MCFLALICMHICCISWYCYLFLLTPFENNGWNFFAVINSLICGRCWRTNLPLIVASVRCRLSGVFPAFLSEQMLKQFRWFCLIISSFHFTVGSCGDRRDWESAMNAADCSLPLYTIFCMTKYTSDFSNRNYLPQKSSVSIDFFCVLK